MIYERMLAVQIYIYAYREDDKWAHGLKIFMHVLTPITPTKERKNKMDKSLSTKNRT
jgi:hypothetical protein